MCPPLVLRPLPVSWLMPVAPRAEVVVEDAPLDVVVLVGLQEVVVGRLKVTRLLLQTIRGSRSLAGLDLLSMSMGFTSATFFHFFFITAFAIDVGRKSSIESVFRGEGAQIR